MIPLDLGERSSGKTLRSPPETPYIFGEAKPLD